MTNQGSRLLSGRSAGRLIATSALLCSACLAHAREIYVAPAGNDAGLGTITEPFGTIRKAIDVAAAGDTIYLRAGVHEQSQSLQALRHGSEGSVIRLWAYPGESPVIDFASQPRATTSRGLVLSGRFWHVRGVHVRNAGDNGVFISGSNNVVENCELYRNEDTGLQISNGGSYNTVLNCDSYENYDSVTHGENADGFAPKLTVGPGNTFRGCRAFFNADDGWDMYEAAYPVVLDSCWAFQNGHNIWQDPAFEGDGNGFKIGGNYVPTWHRVTRCIAFDNPSKGFDQNHNTAGVTVLQCTGWANGVNFSFQETPAAGQDTLVNNLSHAGPVLVELAAVQSHNSWQAGVVTDADFVSLELSLAQSPRNGDGTLPVAGFLRPAPGSALVDAGTNLGLPFSGGGPDLGALESDTTTTGVDAGAWASSFVLLDNYPNPFNPGTTIRFVAPESGPAGIDLYNAVGAHLSRLYEGYAERGKAYTVWLDASGLASGAYISVFSSGGFRQARKLMVVR
jgi:hypothetical protein